MPRAKGLPKFVCTRCGTSERRGRFLWDSKEFSLHVQGPWAYMKADGTLGPLMSKENLLVPGGVPPRRFRAASIYCTVCFVRGCVVRVKSRAHLALVRLRCEHKAGPAA